MGGVLRGVHGTPWGNQESGAEPPGIGTSCNAIPGFLKDGTS